VYAIAVNGKSKVYVTVFTVQNADAMVPDVDQEMADIQVNLTFIFYYFQFTDQSLLNCQLLTLHNTLVKHA
jgi:hypothetical protein